MNTAFDGYKTLAQPTEAFQYKIKKSQFYAYAFPILAEEDVRPLIDKVRRTHPTANHICYAWKLGTEKMSYRANDDGEPNNTAGMPIYGQILSFGLTNVLLIVARIFGGTKLGVGGLTEAYRIAAREVLEGSQIVERTLLAEITLEFELPEMGSVMRTVKQHKLIVKTQQFNERFTLVLNIRKKEEKTIRSVFGAMHKVVVLAK